MKIFAKSKSKLVQKSDEFWLSSLIAYAFPFSVWIIPMLLVSSSTRPAPDIHTYIHMGWTFIYAFFFTSFITLPLYFFIEYTNNNKILDFLFYGIILGTIMCWAIYSIFETPRLLLFAALIFTALYSIYTTIFGIILIRMKKSNEK